MSPAVKALEQSHRVRTFSLNAARQPPPTGTALHTFFEQWHQALDDLLRDEPAPAPLVGVSFGGVIALTYAASRPGRVSHLVLVSAPSPQFTLDSQQVGYLDWPTLSAPLFALRAAGRLGPEVAAALPSWRTRTVFAMTYAARTLRYPSSPRLMAGWVREWMSQDLNESCRRISVPTLVLTGDPMLDQVVPVSDTCGYLRLIRHAEHATLPGTGHLGLLLKPMEFAQIVTAFVSRSGPR